MPEFKKLVKNELPLQLTRKMTNFLGRGFILCMLLHDEKMKYWYYQNFVQVCSQETQDGYLLLDYAEPQFIDNNVIELEKRIGAEKFDGKILDYIIHKIDNNTYLSICLDEYYLQSTAFYGKEHHVHDNLIYGYNNETQKILAVGFNTNFVFDKLEFDYEELNQAFDMARINYKESAPYAVNNMIMQLKPKIADYKFDLKLFTADLNKYLNSEWNEKRLFLYTSFNSAENKNVSEEEKLGKNIHFGISTYDVIISKVKKITQGEFLLDYRVFHTLAEHKKVMLEKFKYIQSECTCKVGFDELVKKYSELATELEKLRLKILVVSNKGVQDSMQNMAFIDEAVRVLEKAKKQDYFLVEEIIESLKSVS